jgi:hypothetical protein
VSLGAVMFALKNLRTEQTRLENWESAQQVCKKINEGARVVIAADKMLHGSSVNIRSCNSANPVNLYHDKSKKGIWDPPIQNNNNGWQSMQSRVNNDTSMALDIKSKGVEHYMTLQRYESYLKPIHGD